MTTLTLDINEEKDLPVIKEILNRFGIAYKVVSGDIMEQAGDKLYKNLKKSFGEIADWEAGKTQLQNANLAINEIESELLSQQ